MVWTKILRRVPGSKLLLKSRYLTDPAANRRLLDWFFEHGITPQQLILHNATPSRQEHFKPKNGSYPVMVAAGGGNRLEMLARLSSK